MSALDNIRRNIDRLLVDANSTPSALAKKIGMSNPLMYAYLSGKSDPGIEQLEKIAAGLGTTVSDLIGKETPKAAPAAEEALRLKAIGMLLKADRDALESVLITLGAEIRPAAGKRGKPAAGDRS